MLLAAALLLPLGLDTFALAAVLGVAGLGPSDRTRVAFVFTAFEAGMPLLGILVGRAIGGLLGGAADYVGIVVLLAAAFYLLRPGREDDEEERRLRLLARARGAAVLGLGLSISVDELTIGLSAGLIGLPVVLALVWIAVQAFAMTQLGLRLGSHIGNRMRERAEWLAGVALIVVALVLLVSTLRTA